ncbi:Acetyl-CoA:oxalate CoA-transferase [Cupriavidus necator]|uniref:CoA transferase n=1 Tax=Cupriavidus necator (strain ATCC 17699 / DSM 428 / KCTC 22496 / NCIMB 10442 / H16 / Stanier 337) TaxID=381666 RepID=Q0K4B9_CUPNH|nr:CoA transferase [Cupriavidus necator]QCC03083.1 CoA transferase [Cupriavidus necator H16]QQB80139.1 CoA transferase [Cupriavidus necator]WKA44398.1 CoA transferase [Cupriavidus necator]CAJ95155.1 Acyl-CoA transferase/carnitine dehydratase [Cupriavidus necator H16]
MMQQSSPGALAGLRVIDLTQMLAGPFCTQILADHGADVIKVEAMTGDGTRLTAPFCEDDTLREYGGYFQSVNRNKRSIAVDLKTVEGLALARKLIDGADIVVENFRAGVMERLGLGWERLRERNPRLVYGTVRGFGDPRSGASPYADWPAYDVVAQAMGGMTGITGPDHQTPMKIGPGVGDTIPALMLCIGILSAVHRVKETGKGQFVDVAMTDAVLAMCERIVYQTSYTGVVPGPEGNRHPLLCPFGLFRARDGYVSIAVANDPLWEKLAAAIGHPELGTDPAFSTNAARVANMQQVIDLLEDFTSGRTKEQIAAVLGGKVPFGPVCTSAEIFADPHYAVRQMLVDVEQPGSAQRVKIAGVPIKLSDTPGAVRRRAPMLGEHTDEVLRAAGYSGDDIDDLRAVGAIR